MRTGALNPESHAAVKNMPGFMHAGAVNPEVQGEPVFKPSIEAGAEAWAMEPAPLAGVNFDCTVVAMAKDSTNCRIVQDAFTASSLALQEQLSKEFVGHVWEATKSDNARHVLTTVINTMRSADFIIDEFRAHGGVWQAACDQHGSEVIEEIIEHVPHWQSKEMVQELLQHPVSLCTDPHGNHVAQVILEHGTPGHQKQLAEVVQKNALSMCTDYHGLAVVSQALSRGAVEDRIAVALAILDQSALLPRMVRSRHGLAALNTLLELMHTGALNAESHAAVKNMPGFMHAGAVNPEVQGADCAEEQASRLPAVC
jgi:hypothetical protein